MHPLLSRILASARRRLTPEPDEYTRRLESETQFFKDFEKVHELPDIFHYWSNKHLAPKKFHPFGITDPEQFYFLYIQKLREAHPGRFLSIVSLGSGNCDMEARLARRLLDAGIEGFSIECLDINESMLQRGKEHARSLGVDTQLRLLVSDFNRWRPEKTYDVVIASQCLHHVLDLEHLFAAIRDCLWEEGYLLTSDMIGRNGHQRWPEALALVQEFWRELPDSYRYNQLLKRHEPEYINHDCSTQGFEGIRAQDILPLLIEYFHFELFIPFSNIVMVFIDRPFGHNFNAGAEWDQDFIDRVNARDEEGILSGELKPTQLLAALRNRPAETQLLSPVLTPQFCVRRA